MIMMTFFQCLLTLTFWFEQQIKNVSVRGNLGHGPPPALQLACMHEPVPFPAELLGQNTEPSGGELVSLGPQLT